MLNVDPETALAAEEANTAEINDKMEALVVNEAYFASPDTDKVLYADELGEIETSQKRLTIEGQRFCDNEEWKKMLVNI